MTDIVIRYSGGPFNIDPLQSIGGLMSETPLFNNSLDNLFNSSPTLITGQDFIDCRAIYILNSSETNTYQDVSIAFDHDPTTGTDIEMWLPLRNEQQQIVFNNFAQVTGGYFILKNGPADNATPTSQISWSSNITTLASNIQSALSAIFSVSVTGSLSGTTGTFIVTFINDDGNKLHPILAVAENALSLPNGTEEITISSVMLPVTNPSGLVVMTPQRGTPINDVAENMFFSNNLPTAANWTTSDTGFILVGTLRPADAFFVWFKRTIPSAAVLSNGLLPSDQFTINIGALD